MHKKKHIKALHIKKHSRFFLKPELFKSEHIDFVKKHQYYVATHISIAGDAPKDIIRYYQFGMRKTNPKKWPLFLAKLGHKNYPTESIMEHLLNRIGEVLGFNMAKSSLRGFGGQIRFLSKYFLRTGQKLHSGAELYSAYLDDKNKKFMDEVEKQRMTQDFFTVEFTEDTLKQYYPKDYKVLMTDFIKLLILDAFIGNNDRHFYNWGIIKNISDDSKPIFSPIYDTARGLLWNRTENEVKKIYQKKKDDLSSFIKKYAEESYPKIGWENSDKLNHFELIEKINTSSYYSNLVFHKQFLCTICNNEVIQNVYNMIDNEFNQLLSSERMSLIKKCLAYRHERIKKIFNFV